MRKIVVDAALRAKLADLSGPVQMYGENGRVLGVFTPDAHWSMYRGADSPLSSSELDRREQETKGYTTRQVLQRLNAL